MSVVEQILRHRLGRASFPNVAILAPIYAFSERAHGRQKDPFDFIEFSECSYGAYRELEAMCLLTFGGNEQLARAVVSTQVQQCYHFLCHVKAGKRVYQVTPGLARQLRDTELRGLTSDDIRLPYEAVLIQVPPDANLRVWNEETGWHAVDCIYMVEDCSGKSVHDGLTRRDEEVRVWRLLVVGKSKNEDPFDDALLFFSLTLRPGRPLDEALQEEADHVKSLNESTGVVAPMNQEWVGLFRWAMNVMIYATWPEADREHVMLNRQARQLWERIQKLPKGEKRSRLQSEFQRQESQRRIVLGRSVVYAPKPEACGTGSPIALHFKVEGHWKKQAHGPKHSLRKLKWIQPYWKGPEDGPLCGAVHLLK